jgi:hypothetical protein
MRTVTDRMVALLFVCLALAIAPVSGGSIVLTGHDPDFHAQLGGNALGAQHINQAAINFIMNATFNPFFAGGATKFLFVESSISPPGGHTDGINGIIASGYTQGVNFDKADASTLNAKLNQLGTVYSGIVIASDFGGILTQSELNILNSRSTDIINFLNAGGGLYAMAESNSGAHLTPGGGFFGFLPFIVTANQLDQGESGFTVTPFGAAMGLTVADINGNASHNIFTATGGMNIVDMDANGHILTLATRSQVTAGGVTPEPGTILTLGLGLIALGAVAIRRRTTA